MPTKLPTLALVLLALTPGCQQAAAPPPPEPSLEARLDADFPSWEWVKVRQRDLDLIKEQGKEIDDPSHVTGDFNGDGAIDHAVQILYPRDGAPTYVLAVYMSEKSQVLEQFRTDGGEFGIILLPARRGEEVYDYEAGKKFTLERDAFTVILSEKTASVYVFENGGFRRVLTSD